MSAPFHFTPRIPSVPHSTPFSASSYKLPNAKSTRPPIHNPYDKFTQPEFDAWIGGITGALKRALGQDEEFNEHEKSNAPTGIHSRQQTHYDGGDDSELSDGAVDDSFAEIKARRAAGKGKARDPREGPGLGKGNSLQPIEIISSDEEEDAEDAAEVELSMAIGDDSDSEEDGSEEEYSWERGQSSSQPLPSPDKTARRKEAITREEYGSENEEGEGEEYDEEGARHDEFDEEEEYDEDEEDRHTKTVQVVSDEIIEIDSDSEDEVDEVDEGELSVEEELSSSPRKAKAQAHGAGNEREDEEFSDGYEEYEDDEEDQLGTSQLLYSHEQIRRPQDNDYEEDEGADMIDADGEVDDDDDIQEIQPPENDTSFPPKPYKSPIDSKNHIELPDPWSGPRAYAEDYYSGGDVRIHTGEKADPHHLGSLNVEDLEPESAFGSEPGKDADVEQPLEEDTSFPPRDESVNRPVDIADPWEGPQTYAEDFYSGGPIHSSQGALPTPHYLGPMDVDYVEELDASAIHQANEEQAQPLDEDISFPSGIESGDIPVEIQDPWIGPETFAEDYYSGGDVRLIPGVPIDPALLSGTSEVEDDIDSFLTPGALTPSQVIDEQNDEIYDDDEEVQGEEQEEGTILPPMTGHYSPSTPQRHNQPIPANAEFIALDDSDTEQEASSSDVVKEKEDVQGSDDLNLEYPQDHQTHQKQNESVHDREMEEGVDEEADELEDEDVVVLPSTLGLPIEERGNDEVDGSKKEFNVPSEDLHMKAHQQTAMLTDESELNTGTQVDLPQDDRAITPDDNDDANGASEAPEKMPAAEITMEKETQMDSFVDLPAEVTTESHLVLVEDAVTAVIEESVDAHMDSEPQKEYTSFEEISVQELSTNTVELIVEPDATTISATTFEDGAIPENHEDSNGADIDGDDEEGPMVNVGDTAESDDDDIRSTPGLENEDAPGASTLPSAPGPSHIHGQLPTPPSEKSRSLPPEVEGSIPAPQAPRGHKVEIEDVPDQDANVPEHREAARSIPGFSSRKPSESPHPVDGFASSIQGEASEFIDPDKHDNFDTFMEEDAYGEADHENDIEIRSVGSEEVVDYETFLVEETRTEGRLTVEPSGREMSLDVVSVGSEEAAENHSDGIARMEENPIEHVAPAPSETAETTVSAHTLEEEGSSFVVEPDQNQEPANVSETLPTEPNLPMPVTADPNARDALQPNEDGDDKMTGPDVVPSPLAAADAQVVEPMHQVKGVDQAASPMPDSNVPIQTDFPMPVTANVDAVDPTDRSHRASPPRSLYVDVQSPSDSGSSPVFAPRPAGEPIPVSIPIHSTTLRAMTQHKENLATTSDSSTQVDGLFTPAEPVVTTTESEIESRRILTELAQYVFGAGAGSSNGPSSITECTQDAAQSSPSHESRPASLLEVPPSTVDRDAMPNNSEAVAHDIFCQVPATNAHVPEVTTTNNGENIPCEIISPASLPYRSPSVSMRVTLTRKPTDPVLMADPYPYCLSTPGPSSMYPILQDEASEDEIGLDNSQSSNSTVEKEAKDRGASSTVIEGEDLKVQHPPVAKGQMGSSGINKDKNTLRPPSSAAPLIAEGSTSKRKRASSPSPSQRPNTPVKTQKAKSRKMSKAERKKPRPSKTIIPEQTSDETILVKPRQTSKFLEPTKRATSVVSIQESQASSGASIAYRMLQSGSRSSSVSSAVPENRSVISQPSPTVNKPNALASQPTVNLESLFHAHGKKRKALALTVQHTFSPRAPSKKPQLSRFPSTSTIPDQPDQPSPTSSTAALSPAVPPPKPDTSAKTTITPSRTKFSTPVTRSHCRYHRISLPKEEGGTRVNFLVPGCSLNDKELMDEEEIVDHGDATVDDSRNMLKDIENLDFSLDLIGIIRQLVGLDILREQEVFYLPQPGEVVTWKKASLQKTASERVAMVRAPGEASSHAGSPGGGHSAAGMNASPYNRPPASYSSYSSSPSVDSAFIRGSIPSSKPDQSDDEEPAAKRSRPSPSDEMGPPSSQPKGKHAVKPKKSKKIDLTYEPGEEDPDEESDHTTPTSSRKRRKFTQGVKRSRMSEILPVGNGGDERESKKLRSDSTTSTEHKPQSEPQLAPTAPEQPAT